MAVDQVATLSETGPHSQEVSAPLGTVGCGELNRASRNTSLSCQRQRGGYRHGWQIARAYEVIIIYPSLFILYYIIFLIGTNSSTSLGSETSPDGSNGTSGATRITLDKK